jgi:hypothetical protein
MLEKIMRAMMQCTGVILLALCVGFSTGCKKDSTSTDTPDTITGDLFPLVEGHLYVYNEYTTDMDGNKISGTDHRVATRVGPSVSFGGRSGNLLIDSVYSIDGQLTGLDTLINASSGNDGTIYFTLPTTMFADFPVPFSLPSLWIPFFQPAKGVGASYDIFTLDTTITYQSIPLRIQLTLSGSLNQKENVQVPAGTYSAYRGELNYTLTATSGAITFLSQSGNVLKMWLYENTGPVKISYSPMGTATTAQTEELVGKNF